MRVTRKEVDFKPITITLETKEEADYIWHLLNVGDPFKDYSEQEKAEKLDEKVGGEIFNVFDEIFNVRKG